MIYIGIDPGVSGGIAAVDDDGRLVIATKMPDTERGVYTLISQLPLNRGYVDLQRRAVLEKAQPMPKQGVVSMFTYGRGYGALLMALTAADIPFDLVTSPVWQAAMQCRSGGLKTVTKRRAEQLFPYVKVTHAIADALLIAEFCRRRERGSSGQETERAASQREGRQSGGEGSGQAGTESGGALWPSSDLAILDRSAALAGVAGHGAPAQREARQPLREHRRGTRPREPRDAGRG